MNAWLDTLRARWAALAPRERRMVAVATALVAFALFWWVGIAPALATLRAAPAEHARLDAQLQQMNTLQARAKALQAQPRANPAESMRALESGVRDRLGASAQVQSQGAGEGARVVLKDVDASALAQWLAQARSNARALTREAHLTRAGARPAEAPATAGTSAAARAALAARGANGPKAAAPAGPETDTPRWDGNIVLGLPTER